MNSKLSVVVILIMSISLPLAALVLVILSFVLREPLWAKILTIDIFVYLLIRFMVFIAFECEEIWEEI